MGGVIEEGITYPLKLAAKPLLAYSDMSFHGSWCVAARMAFLIPSLVVSTYDFTDGGKSPLSICSHASTHASESKPLCASLLLSSIPAGKGSINISGLLFLRLWCSHFRSSHLFFQWLLLLLLTVFLTTLMPVCTSEQTCFFWRVCIMLRTCLHGGGFTFVVTPPYGVSSHYLGCVPASQLSFHSFSSACSGLLAEHPPPVLSVHCTVFWAATGMCVLWGCKPPEPGLSIWTVSKDAMTTFLAFPLLMMTYFKGLTRSGETSYQVVIYLHVSCDTEMQ